VTASATLRAVEPAGAITPMAPARAVVRLEGVSKSFSAGDEPAVLSGIDLEIPERGFCAMLGRSGSGKSTLLRLIAGLLPPSSGTILVDGIPVDGPPPSARYVFQDYGDSLFPWLKARDNVRFGLKHDVTAKGHSREQADHYLELVGLAEAGDRYPWELSGGMQQRLAIARALASRPRILLMDEPFGAVDALSRARLQDLILKLWADLGLTVVLVTHDIEEAVYLAERVIVLDPKGHGLRASIPVELDQPRTQLGARDDARFGLYRRQLHGLVLE